MKKLLIFALLLVSTIVSAQTDELAFNQVDKNYQLSMPFKASNLNLNLNIPSKTYSHNSNNNDIGVAMLIAGASFVVGGLLTQTEVYGMYGPDKPFFKQPKMYAIVGGGIILGAGLVIIIN